MGVSPEILAVPRPVNTIVEDRHINTVKRYAVRERAGIKYIAGGNPQPRNGKVIGHIINFQYVPIPENCHYSEPSILSYGAATLARNFSKDIYSDLLSIFSANDATTIISIAILQFIYPNITSTTMSKFYNKTFVKKYFPGASISKNSISKLYKNLGSDDDKIKTFYKTRVEKIENDHHVVIDGTLKQDNSTVNDLSNFSRKYKVKGVKDISIIYAYDIEIMEPICAQVFPGNYVDSSAYKSFVEKNNIENGIFVTDKGMPPSQIEDILKNHPDIFYFTPLKRNTKFIDDYNLLEFDGKLSGIHDVVYYKKVKILDGSFLYCYKNQIKANKEAMSYGYKITEKDSFNIEKYKERSTVFGVIVFKSNMDLDPNIAYRIYDDRWIIELVFKRYKLYLDNDRTNVHSDFSVRGAEFINFLSTLITCRVIHFAESKAVFEHMTYGQMLEDLKSAWRKVDAPEEPESNDGYWGEMTLSDMKTLELLELSKPVEVQKPRKRGRPRKTPVVDEEPKPKRPRGRPRKTPAVDEEPKPKRPRGRPKKNPEE